jgi:hypothetical protein
MIHERFQSFDRRFLGFYRPDPKVLPALEDKSPEGLERLERMKKTRLAPGPRYLDCLVLYLDNAGVKESRENRIVHVPLLGQTFNSPDAMQAAYRAWNAIRREICRRMDTPYSIFWDMFVTIAPAKCETSITYSWDDAARIVALDPERNAEPRRPAPAIRPEPPKRHERPKPKGQAVTTQKMRTMGLPGMGVM